LGIEVSTTSSTSYIAKGTTQLLSVPYALYTNSEGSITGNTVRFSHYVEELFGGGIVVSVWKTNGVVHGLIGCFVDRFKYRYTMDNSSISILLYWTNGTKP
jgi:hypothetical protein